MFAVLTPAGESVGTLETTQCDSELSTVGVNSGYPRLTLLGASGVAPAAVVAVDNP